MHQKTNNSNAFLKSRVLFCAFLSGLLFSFAPVYAQTAELEQSISISVSPQTPGPREDVSITIESFSTDLNRATIEWFENGSLQRSDIGERSFNFTTRGLGQKTTILIAVTTQDGDYVERRLEFIPSRVGIVWEAETYAPPFYRGKALASPGSHVRVTAIPQLITTEGSAISHQNLVYTWSKDGRVLGSMSGTGRRSIEIEAPVVGSTQISVLVSSYGGSLSARASTQISSRAPQIILYEKHPLYGIVYNSALQNTFALSSEEASLVAEPYYFSQEDLARGVGFTWSLNNQTITEGIRGKEITLRREGGASGNASLEIEIVNVNKLLQAAQASLPLRFGLQNNSGL